MSSRPSDRLNAAPHPEAAPLHGPGHGHAHHPAAAAEAGAMPPERFHLALEQVRDELLLIDDQGRIAYANPAAARALGIPRAELAGTRLHAWLGDGRDLAEALVRDGATARRPARSSWRCATATAACCSRRPPAPPRAATATACGA